MSTFWTESAWIWLDGAVILIFAVCIILAYIRGFIKSSHTILALVMTGILWFVLQAPFENWISQSQLGENIRQNMTRQVSQDMENDSDGARENLALPKFIQVKIQGQMDAENTSELITSVGNAAADFVIRILSIVLLFILIRIGIFVLLKVLDLIFKLPVLKFVNKTAGILVGVINALLVVYLVAAAVTFLIPAESLPAFHLAMSRTYIAKIFYNNNILMEIFM